MIFKSIRWRLQIWYGVILMAVLAGFGFTSFQLERGRQFRRIDEELQRRVGALANVIRQPPGRPGERPMGRPLRENLPLPDRPFDEGPPESRPRPPGDFRLPPALASLFGESDTNAFYYVIWSRDGNQLAHSANLPSPAPPPRRTPRLSEPSALPNPRPEPQPP